MKMQAFPLFALISLVSLADAFKVLLFWSVDSDKATQDMVKANVAYAKSAAQGGPDCCNVMLSHYKGQPTDWDQEWYSQHVVQYRAGPGYKFKALRELYRKNDVCDKWETLYEWVWALDSDIDFTLVDLKKLFKDARDTTSLIVSPTFKGDPSQWTDFNSLLEDAEADSTKHQIHPIGKPDEKCKHRHTTYVEMTAPALHGLALASLFAEGECEHCIGEKAEWGLDRVWCSRAKKAVGGITNSCAYLDEATVLHLDWNRAEVNEDFLSSESEVRSRYPDDFATIKALDCVPKK